MRDIWRQNTKAEGTAGSRRVCFIYSRSSRKDRESVVGERSAENSIWSRICMS